jgi:hypothetical protein
MWFDIYDYTYVKNAMLCKSTSLLYATSAKKACHDFVYICEYFLSTIVILRNVLHAVSPRNHHIHKAVLQYIWRYDVGLYFLEMKITGS